MRGRGKFLISALALALALALAPASAGSLLPNGKQTFVDANGTPLSGGRVYFYVPNTLTPKTTWRDPGQTLPNTNPVVLDSAGRAVIYGGGNYRQIVKDQAGNLIWDQLTQGTGSSGAVVNPVIPGSTTIGICSGVFPIQNNSSAPITLIMPTDPQDGDSCTFSDAGNNAGTYSVTFSFGAKILSNGTSKFYFDWNTQSITFTWVSGLSRWLPS